MSRIPPSQMMEDAIVMAYKADNANDRVGDPTIHVSNLIDFCPRTYFLCKKHDRSYHATKYFGIQTKWDFDIGHAVQSIQIRRFGNNIFCRWKCRHCGRIEIGRTPSKKHKCVNCKGRAWKSQDLRIEVRYPLKDGTDLIVVGHVDYVFIVDRKTGIIVDAKSISADYFDKLVDPQIEYRRQGQLYMWMANHPNSVFPGEARQSCQIHPEQAVIAYGVKGSRRMPFKFFDVSQDKKFINTTEKSLKKLVTSLNTGKAPVRICKSQHNLMARQCVVRDICFDQVLPGME